MRRKSGTMMGHPCSAAAPVVAFFGEVWSALAMALWLLMLAGRTVLPTAMTPSDWHFHEMVFGFVPFVVAGFLLTAVPNWTGRRPV